MREWEERKGSEGRVPEQWATMFSPAGELCATGRTRISELPHEGEGAGRFMLHLLLHWLRAAPRAQTRQHCPRLRLKASPQLGVAGVSRRKQWEPDSEVRRAPRRLLQNGRHHLKWERQDYSSWLLCGRGPQKLGTGWMEERVGGGLFTNFFFLELNKNKLFILE